MIGRTWELTTLHLAWSDRRCLGRDEFVAQTLVRPLFTIMMEKFSYGRPEMPFAKEHHSVQALGLGGLDKPLGKCVQIGPPRREDEWLHATVPQQAPKGRGVQRISIED